MVGRRIHIFVSYAHADLEVVDQLRAYIGWLENDERISVFDDRELLGGEKWDPRLKTELDRADIVLLVVTAAFGNSRYCTQVELKQALRRSDEAGVCIIPILAATCDWEAMPITDRQALPKDDNQRLKPLNKWGPDVDVALTQIAKHVRRNVEAIVARLAAAEDERSGPPAGAGVSAARSLIWSQPEPPDRCLGRAADLAKLLAALAADPCRPIVLYGGAGMGKSTLTREAACNPDVIAHYGARRVWVGLDRAPDHVATMAAIHAALALPPGQEPWPSITTELGSERSLIVLDNLETPWAQHQAATEDLLARLARIPGVALMVTLRSGNPPTRPAWGTRLEVEHLGSPYDRELLLAIAGDVDSGDPLLPDVLAALDGWPLAIELFAAQADGLGGIDLAWRGWRSRRNALRARGEPEPDPLAVSLGTSLESPRMRSSANGARRLYAMAGRLPDGLARSDAETLLPGCGDEAIACLLRARLARPDNDRVRMLAPVREHASGIELSTSDESAMRRLYFGLADALRRYFNGDHHGVELSRLRRELRNIESVIAAAVESDIVDSGEMLQGELGSLYLAVGRARAQLGQRTLARQFYERARDIFSALAARNACNPQWQSDLSVSWRNLGDVMQSQGDLQGAFAAFLESKKITDGLAAADPGNAQWQREVAVSWSRIGQVLEFQDDIPGALQAYTADMEITAKLAAADPRNAKWQRDLSLSWATLGDARLAQHDLPGALAAYAEGKNIADRLAVADPGNAEWQFDLGISNERIGDVLVVQGQLDEAAQAYQRRHDIIAKLAAADPGNAEWQRDLSVSWNRLGDVRSAQGDLPGTLAAYIESKKVADRLAAADPGNAGWQRDLSVSWEKLGNVRSAQGDLPGALAAYGESKNIRDKLTAADPGNAEWQRDLIVSHWNLADLSERTPDRAGDAAGHWAQALAIARTLADTGRLAPTDAWFVATLEQRLAAARAGHSPPP